MAEFSPRAAQHSLNPCLLRATRGSETAGHLAYTRRAMSTFLSIQLPHVSWRGSETSLRDVKQQLRVLLGQIRALHRCSQPPVTVRTTQVLVIGSEPDFSVRGSATRDRQRLVTPPSSQPRVGQAGARTVPNRLTRLTALATLVANDVSPTNRRS